MIRRRWKGGSVWWERGHDGRERRKRGQLNKRWNKRGRNIGEEEVRLKLKTLRVKRLFSF